MRNSGRRGRPRGATAAFVFLSSSAVIALTMRASSGDPERELRGVVLTVTHQGASAAAVERDIVLPIEQAIASDGAAGRIARLESTVRPGEARVTAYAPASGLDAVTGVVNDAVSRARPRLPPSIETRVTPVVPTASDWFRVTPATIGTSLAQAATVGLALAVFTGRRRRPAVVDQWLERAAERFHDGVAWVLQQRTAVATLAVVSGLALALHLAVGNPSHGDGHVTFDVRGPDPQTLAGVADRIADEMRAVRGVTRVAAGGDPTATTARPVQIDRVDRQRIVRVHAVVQARRFDDVRRVISAKVATTPTPPGYTASEQPGSNRTSITVRAVVTALSAALAVTLAVLTIQFRSLVEPLVVAWSAWLSIGAVAAFLVVSGHSPTSGTAVGAALAIAIAAWSTTNLLERARRRRAPGRPARVTLIEAARRLFRPVVVGTAVVSGATLPVMLTGATEDVASLGTVVLLGVFISGIVTLLVAPALAASFEAVAEQGREWAAKRRV